MYCWTTEEVYSRLDRKMNAAYHIMLDASKNLTVNMRQAASVVAVDRVVEAMRLRGWI